MTGNGGFLRINGPNIVHENIEGETVILNLDTGSYFSIVDVAAAIWSYIEKGVPVIDILSLIRKNYECSRPDLEKEVNSFISQLEHEGLVITVDDSLLIPQNWKEQINIRKSKAVFNAPVLNKYTDMQDLLLLDPIHQVDDTGWPSNKSAK